MKSEDKILLVDDELPLLEAIVRQLRKSHMIDTAASGSEALERFETTGPYAAIVSDLRMPGMDGITLLKQVRQKHPECVRIILSGNADLPTVIEAVNSGQIFRFLTKPCSRDELATTFSSAIRQHQLLTAERELLGKTLKGSINMLSELLSLAKPIAFAKGYRIRNIVVEVARSMGMKQLWRFEVAALLSQIGCITIPDDILKKINADMPLNEREEKMFANHPRIGAQLVARIPRLKAVADIIKDQLGSIDEEVYPSSRSPKNDTALASQILQAALDYDKLAVQGMTHAEAMRRMYGQQEVYNPDVLQHLESIRPDLTFKRTAVSLYFDDLVPGMIAAEDIVAKNGTKIIEKGQEITWPVLQGLQNFVDHMGIQEPIRVWTE